MNTQQPKKDSNDQLGMDDPLVLKMKEYQIPVTRQNYLELAYPDGVPEMTAELEQQLPEFLQLKTNSR